MTEAALSRIKKNMNKNSEKGFSYIDVMCAIVILTVGILALLSAITFSVVQTSAQHEQLAARQIAASTLESLMSAKETTTAQAGVTQLGWISIGNVGSNPDEGGTPRGIFLTGFRPVRADAGLDRIVGTADDTGAEIPGYQRQILIEDICDPDRPSSNCPSPGPYSVRIRAVTVTVTYRAGSVQRQEQIITLLTDYGVDN